MIYTLINATRDSMPNHCFWYEYVIEEEAVVFFCF